LHVVLSAHDGKGRLQTFCRDALLRTKAALLNRIFVMHTVDENIGFREVRRRRIVLAATAGVGAVGAIGALTPFLESMAPSEAAKAAGAPVEADLTRVGPGRILTVEWRGRPIWVLHRTDAMLKSLAADEHLLLDPKSTRPQQPAYARNRERSINPRYFVGVGVCTHLGCIPGYRPDPGASAELGDEWPGGFYCPCHGSRFDLAGRVFKNVPAPLNLEIPPHTYLGETRLLIGEDKPKRT
jgi:ubiquinol-cytochrome c reductase iron-sulfur subunit